MEARLAGSRPGTYAHDMRRGCVRRNLAGLGVATVMAFVSLPGEFAHAAPRSGNQCKKREVGKKVGTLTCTKLGSKYVWVVNKSTTQGNCHPAYTPCVPIDSDVDCAGGSGNGPSYVKGPVTVINPGDDPYGLDGNDKDGIGCEK